MLIAAASAAAPAPRPAAPTLRVLHVHSGNMLGGVESMLLAQAEASRDSIVQLEFALCFAGAFSRSIEAADVPCTLLGEPRLRNPLRLRRARRALGIVLHRRPVDVAVVHSGWTQALFGSVLQRSGVAWVRWQHAPLERSSWMERLALRHVPAAIICNSAFTRAESAWAYPGLPAEVVYCPVAKLPCRQPGGHLRQAFATSPDDVVIVLAGRFEPLKGHAVLFSALARLARDARWTCWIAGAPQSPSERTCHDGLRRLARDLGIEDRLRFTGLQADMPGLLAAADIYCQPNTGPEGFGMALAEALASGLPVVTTSIGAANEIVTAAGGLLVPSGDAEALAAALAPLIDSPALRDDLGARAAARATALPDGAAHLRALADALRPVLRARRDLHA